MQYVMPMYFDADVTQP